jgi:hypothetical protein
MSYDHITKDLCRKACEDVQATVDRTAALLPDPADRMMVAISAASGSLASAAGYAAALVKRDTGSDPSPEDVVDTLWQMLRPGILSAAGGDRRPFEDLLARVSRESRA